MNAGLALLRLKVFSKTMEKKLSISPKIKYTSAFDTALSSTNNDVVQISVPDVLLSDENGIVGEYDFVEACISTAHELHHAAVLSQSRGLRKDIVDLSESYISRFNNNATYEREYNKFSYEIAAERYALKTTHDYLNNKFPTLDTDAIMLDYVNAKALSNSREYPYPIQSIRKFTDMQQVFEAFDKAYEKSFVAKKNFQRKGNYVSDVLDQNASLKRGFEQAETGREQTKFVVAINARNDSDLFKTFTSLKPKNYSMKQIYDAQSRRFAESTDEILNNLSSDCTDLQDEIFK